MQATPTRRSVVSFLGLVALLLLASFSSGFAASSTGLPSPHAAEVARPATALPPTPARPALPTSSCPITGVAPLLRGGVVAPAGAAGGIGGLSAHSVDPMAVPNKGFEFNVTGYAMPSPVPNANDSFLLSEEEAIGTTDLIMGLISIGEFGAESLPFWAILDNTTDQFTQCGYSEYAVLAGQVVSFQALNLGGDYWEVLYRGSPISTPPSTTSANLTLDGSDATWTGGVGVVTLANWTGSTPWVPRFANLTGTMNVVTVSQWYAPHPSWYLPHPVYSEWNGSRGGPFWGEAGPAQLPYLAPGEMEVGSGVPPVQNRTALWTTAAPTAIEVAVSASPASLSGGALSQITVRAEATDGVPLANLGVVLSYAGGGTFSPTLPWTTNGSGLASGNFTAPIVSALLQGPLTAEVSSALYAGAGNVTVTVAPTTLSVAVALSASSVPEGGVVNVSLRATLGGGPLRGPEIDLVVSASVGGGVFSPVGDWTTNAAGYSNGTYQAPHQVGSVQLVFTVSLTGYSGSGSATLNVTGPSGGASTSGLSDTEIGAGVGALVLVALVVVLLLRRRSEALASPADAGPTDVAAPEHDVEPPSSAPEASPTDEEVAEASTSRTCPGCGREVGEDEGRFCRSCGSPVARNPNRPKSLD